MFFLDSGWMTAVSEADGNKPDRGDALAICRRSGEHRRETSAGGKPGDQVNRWRISDVL